METRGRTGFELPPPARLAHDLLWARSTLTGRRPRLDDLEEADRLAALLIDRWRPHVEARRWLFRLRIPHPRRSTEPLRQENAVPGPEAAGSVPSIKRR